MHVLFGQNKLSDARYTLVIKKMYLNQVGSNIKDSLKMEFPSKEEALKYIRGIPEDYTWEIRDPPTSTE